MVDGTFALDGGAEFRRWEKRHGKSKSRAAKNKARLKAYDERCARFDKEQRRQDRVASVERVDRAAFLKARKGQGYTPGLPYKDMTGERFGLLIVLRPGGHLKSGSKKWWVQCDCGSRPKQVPGTNLRQGNQRSCGCSGPGDLRAKWHSPKYYRFRAARDAARRKELAKPISYQIMRLRRNYKEGSAEAKLLSKARNLIVWAELQKGIIKPRKEWKTARYH